MDIFAILTGVGGLALFLYGMTLMGDNLSELSGGKMEIILEKLTSTKIRAVLLGTFVTAVIQSSSAATVMVVGFVNSGIMQLRQAVGIIMGANIGTTITSWLLSLTGVSGSSVFVRLLKPSSFSPIMAIAGTILIMSHKRNDSKKEIGSILLGFAILMFGMETMSGAVKPLAENEEFGRILIMFSNPILGMMAGALITAVIQSSSASVGILQAFCLTGAVRFSTAIPIIMGQNIGTCVTALISSFGASANAKRTSMIHLYFNLIGSLVFMSAFYGINSIANFTFLNSSASVLSIAVIHSLFNFGCVILLYPFSDLLVKLAISTIKDDKKKEERNLPKELAVLDDRFLDKPGFAMEISRKAANKMAEEVRICFNKTIDLLNNYDESIVNEIRVKEDLGDIYEDLLGTYLVKLSGQNLSKNDSRTLSILLHCISDLERISDHSLNVAESIDEMRKKNLTFSDESKAELKVLTDAVLNAVEMTVRSFIDSDLESAKEVEPLEEAIDGLNVILRQNHINRLIRGVCTIELGINLEDIITDLERISDHCSNIAVCMIQVSDDIFDTHAYIDENVRNMDWFKNKVNMWRKIYYIEQKREG